jgi:L-lactate dehydrogenase complex protein LldG
MIKMERDRFLQSIAQRLGRESTTEVPVRKLSGVSSRYIDHPFGIETISRAQWPVYFKDQIESIGGSALIADSLSEAAALISDILKPLDGVNIVTWSKDEFVDWNINWLWEEKGSVEYVSNDLIDSSTDLTTIIRSAKVGITTASFAVVNTGTIVLNTNQFRNRSVSLLPALHLVLVRESQLVARLGDAFPTDHSEAIPSSIHFITGPSRSADIENDLSIGVHGPAAVTVIICKGI